MIFLAGHHGAGKTRLAKIMANWSFLSIDLGPTLRRIHREQRDIPDFKDWIKKGEETIGLSFTDDLLIIEIERLRGLPKYSGLYIDIVIVGSRSRVGIERIQSAVSNINTHKSSIIFIDAPFDSLRRRYNKREGVALDSVSFKDLIDLEADIETVRDIANFVLYNDSSIGNMETAIEEILFQKIGYVKKQAN
ncbi:MAG: hypothetical protein AAB394_02640 [Patescibacteria group bacterium]